MKTNFFRFYFLPTLLLLILFLNTLGCRRKIAVEAKLNRVVVNFNARGGTEVGAQLIQRGTLATLPPPSEKKDSINIGWYKEPELKNRFDFSKEIVNDNITLYAKWASDAYKVVRLEITQHYSLPPDAPYLLLVQQKSYAVRLFITNKNATGQQSGQNSNGTNDDCTAHQQQTNNTALPNPDFKVYLTKDGITKEYPVKHPGFFPSSDSLKKHFDTYEFNMHLTSYATVPAGEVLPGEYQIAVKQEDYVHSTASVRVTEPYSINIKVVPLEINPQQTSASNTCACNPNADHQVDEKVMDSMKNYMLNRMPFSDINISKRNPFRVEVKLTDACLNVSRSNPRSAKEWSNVVGQLAILQATEQGQVNDVPVYYYGIVPTCAPFRGVFLGLAAGVGAEGMLVDENNKVKLPTRSAMGRIGVDPLTSVLANRGDPINDFYTTFLHEMGHTLNLRHVFCNNEGGWDKNYPYYMNILDKQIAQNIYKSDKFLSKPPNGLYGYLPKTPIVKRDGLYDDKFCLRNPWQLINSNKSLTMTRLTEIMSYCSGSFFSDYSFNKIQLYLLSRGQGMRPAHQPTVQQSMPAKDRMLIAGTIYKEELTLRPVQSSAASFTTPNTGDYTLQIRTKNGTVERRFQAQELSDIDDMENFFVFLDLSDEIEDIQVFKNGKLLRTSAASADKLAAAPIPHRSSSNNGDFVLHAEKQSASSQLVQAVEAGGKLQINWDHLTHPYLQVVHIGTNGERNVLTLESTGGHFTIPTDKLPLGGYFDISVSTGLNIYRYQLARK